VTDRQKFSTIRVAPLGKTYPREPFGLPTLAPFGAPHVVDAGTKRLREVGAQIKLATWNRATALLLRGNLTDTELQCYRVECATLKIAGLASPSEVGRGK
jgi:hypothetical protein